MSTTVSTETLVGFVEKYDDRATVIHLVTAAADGAKAPACGQRVDRDAFTYTEGHKRDVTCARCQRQMEKA